MDLESEITEALQENKEWQELSPWDTDEKEKRAFYIIGVVVVDVMGAREKRKKESEERKKRIEKVAEERRKNRLTPEDFFESYAPRREISSEYNVGHGY